VDCGTLVLLVLQNFAVSHRRVFSVVILIYYNVNLVVVFSHVLNLVLCIFFSEHSSPFSACTSVCLALITSGISATYLLLTLFLSVDLAASLFSTHICIV